jgi:CheY-like chemotaxis protein
MMPGLFERFRQADGSITRKHGGMGLGLAIARHIMDLHGGSVTAESAGLGQGATFTVRLPRLNEAAAMTRSDARQPAAPEASDGRLIGIHVLAVDDDANALGMLASMLELGGATVSKANSAAEAIEQFRRQSDIAVVLSDIGMPDRDGYDLIESLRRDFAERAERVAAVAITGYARDEDHARALHAGFDAHLAKPFGMDELFDAIVGLVRNRQSNAQASAPLRE